MKLLFVSNLFPPHALGGYEHNCRDIAVALRAMGHQVDIITSMYGVAEPVREPNVWRVLELRHDYGTEKDRSRSGAGGSRVQVDLHNVGALRAELSRLRPDATMLWGAGNLGPLPAWVAEAYGRTVYNVADPWLLPLLQPVRGRAFGRNARRAYRRLLGIADRPLQGPIVFVSRALQEHYEADGARVERSRVNYLGVDADLFKPQAQAIGRVSDVRRILFVGRIEPRKGTTTLVRAFAALQKREGLPELRLTLVGPSAADYRAELSALAEQHGVGDKVAIHAPVPRSELPGLYAEHDVLAFPSEWLEPFALTPLEAMACAIPVVSSLAGGSAELVRDGENAMSFRAGDADDLADKLAWVVGHRDEAAAMGLRASEEVRSKYTLRHEAEGLLEALSDAVSQRGGHAMAGTRGS